MTDAMLSTVELIGLVLVAAAAMVFVTRRIRARRARQRLHERTLQRERHDAQWHRIHAAIEAARAPTGSTGLLEHYDREHAKLVRALRTGTTPPRRDDAPAAPVLVMVPPLDAGARSSDDTPPPFSGGGGTFGGAGASGTWDAAPIAASVSESSSASDSCSSSSTDSSSSSCSSDSSSS